MNDIESYDSMLNLVFPSALGDDIADFLLLHPNWCNGFSMLEAQGMGQGATLTSSMEKVQGKCQRNLIIIVGERKNHVLLVEALSLKIKNRDVVYWIAPLHSFGSLA